MNWHTFSNSSKGKWSFLSLVVAVAVAAWRLDRQQTPVQTPGKKKKRNVLHSRQQLRHGS